MQIFNMRLENNQLLNQDYKLARQNIEKGVKYTVGKYEKSLREFTDDRVERVKREIAQQHQTWTRCQRRGERALEYL